MNSEIQIEPPAPTPEVPRYSVPWRFMDNWIGVVLLGIIDAIIFIISLRASKAQLAQSALIIVLELAYLLPVILIFAWRHIDWRSLGFGKFNWGTLSLGCGLLVGAYVIIIIHNTLLYFLGVDTQGQDIIKVFSKLNTPIWFFIVGVIVAPFVEESFFRGFLFQGLRARYGGVPAMLLSSAIFAIAHLQLAALIPTFILGCVLAYVYHRSNSLWPGMTLHFLVNAFGLLGAYFATHLQNGIPF